MTDTSSKLSKYIDAYRRLKYQLQYEIDDYRYKQKGGKLYYAVDFSEIFAYLFPAKSYQHFFLISSNEDKQNRSSMQIASLQAFHQLLLKHVFFEASDKLILLPPYVSELELLINDLHNKAFDQLAKDAARIFKYANSAVEHDRDFRSISKLVNDVDISDEFFLTEQEEARVLNFVQKYGHILALAEDDYQGQSPLAKIRKFFEDNIFESLEEFTKTHLDGLDIAQTNVFATWYTYLKDKRGNVRLEFSENDAAAVNIISQINKSFQTSNKNERLLLITRSQHMHDCHDMEYESGMWNGLGNYPALRHPRVYSVLSILLDENVEDVIQLTTNQLEALNNFLETTSRSQLNKDIPEDLSSLIVTINRYVEDMQSLVLSKKEADVNVVESKNRVQSAKKILDLLKLENIQNHIANRLDYLLYEIGFSYNLLGLQYEASPTANTLQRDTHRITAQSMPYHLRLSSQESQELIESYKPGSLYQLNQVVSAFKEGFKRDLGFETILAMAYILGTLNKWDYAVSFCNFAHNLAQNMDDGLHELYFFQAVCLRKVELSLENFLKAQMSLEKALKETPNDPRYLNEKGSQILMMNSLDTSKYEDKVLGSADGLALLSKAEQYVNRDIDKELYALILNNRVYYLIMHERLEEVSHLKEELKLLEKIQTEIEFNEDHWPSFILDTLACGEWVLDYDEIKNDETRKKIIVHRLERAVESLEITNDEKRTRKDHLWAIKNNIRILSAY